MTKKENLEEVLFFYIHQAISQKHDMVEEPEIAKRSIGYLPEIPLLYMDMTVLEYLQFSAELKKISKYEREEEIEKALELVRLEDVKHRLIKNLSKGYKQRVGLAQAVLGFPEIIILDEPVESQVTEGGEEDESDL